ncbi:hypothetical protein ACWC4J_41375 [Streptomyces sp. NPDC001356]
MCSGFIYVFFDRASGTVIPLMSTEFRIGSSRTGRLLYPWER